jgi:hypothetical protein
MLMIRNPCSFSFLHLLTTLVVSLFFDSALSAEIGTVEEVRLYAYGTPDGQAKRALFSRDQVTENEIVETVSDGALTLVLRDGTHFRLGGASKVTLDAFVYDPDTSIGKMSLNLSKGVFRFVSGSMRKEGVKLVKPTAIIGIRGTDFTVTVGADNSTTVQVDEGEIGWCQSNAN